MSNALPEGFQDLSNWAAEWSQPTQNRRWDKRLASSKEEIMAFYEALQPRLTDILDYCDQFDLGALPEDAARLYDMTLMLAEIAPNVELYRGQPGVPYAFDETRFIAVHGDVAH